LNKNEDATESFNQGLRVSNRFLGAEDPLAKKFKERKEQVGMPKDDTSHEITISKSREKRSRSTIPEEMASIITQKDSTIEQVQENKIKNERKIERLKKLAKSEENEYMKAKEEELKKIQEIQAKAQAQIEEVKQEKERALAELKASNEKQLKELEEKLLATLQAQQEINKKKLKEKAQETSKQRIEVPQEEPHEPKKSITIKQNTNSKGVSLQRSKRDMNPSENKIEEQLILKKEELPEIEIPKAAHTTEEMKALVEEQLQVVDNTLCEEQLSPKDYVFKGKEDANVLEIKLADTKQSNIKKEKNEPHLELNKEYLYCKLLINPDHTYKISVYGKINSTQLMEARIVITCIDNPSLKIQEEFLDDSSIKQILTATSFKDVAPYGIREKGLKTLPDIIKYGIIPFAQVGQENEERNIEVWVHASGIIADSGLQLSFLNTICHMGLHHVEGQRLRLSLTFVESEGGPSLYIDMDYDKAGFAKMFPLKNIEEYKKSANEVWLPCFKPVPIDFLNYLDTALTEIESYLRRTHKGKFTFDEVLKDETLRCILIVVNDSNKTLWILRKEGNFEIYCKTLYKVKCKCLR